MSTIDAAPAPQTRQQSSVAHHNETMATSVHPDSMLSHLLEGASRLEECAEMAIKEIAEDPKHVLDEAKLEFVHIFQDAKNEAVHDIEMAWQCFLQTGNISPDNIVKQLNSFDEHFLNNTRLDPSTRTLILAQRNELKASLYLIAGDTQKAKQAFQESADLLAKRCAEPDCSNEERLTLAATMMKASFYFKGQATPESMLQDRTTILTLIDSIIKNTPASLKDNLTVLQQTRAELIYQIALCLFSLNQNTQALECFNTILTDPNLTTTQTAVLVRNHPGTHTLVRFNIEATPKQLVQYKQNLEALIPDIAKVVESSTGSALQQEVTALLHEHTSPQEAEKRLETIDSLLAAREPDDGFRAFGKRITTSEEYLSLQLLKAQTLFQAGKDKETLKLLDQIYHDPELQGNKVQDALSSSSIMTGFYIKSKLSDKVAAVVKEVLRGTQNYDFATAMKFMTSGALGGLMASSASSIGVGAVAGSVVAIPAITAVGFGLAVAGVGVGVYALFKSWDSIEAGTDGISADMNTGEGLALSVAVLANASVFTKNPLIGKIASVAGVTSVGAAIGLPLSESFSKYMKGKLSLDEMWKELASTESIQDTLMILAISFCMLRAAHAMDHGAILTKNERELIQNLQAKAGMKPAS